VRQLLVGSLAALTLVLAGAGQAGNTGGAVAFGPPRYVDLQLSGGEPMVMSDPIHGTLVYTSHEGTTHLYRDGLLSSPWGDFAYVSNYCNQVNNWYSTDGGVNWIRDSYLDSPCPENPTYTGFSDPDLTMDAGGRLYNTGINLVNDALFSSVDGGKNWTQGTPYCHDGDRPWLAGGFANEVFMGTDPAEDALNHRVFVSTDGGQTCTATGIPDFGSTADGGAYTGFGKLYWDAAKSRLAEPTVYTDANGNTNGLGVSTWSRGDAAFTPHHVANTTFVGFFPVLALDAANTIYLVWTPDTRQAGTSGGCSGAPTPAPNSVMLTYSKDWAKTWSKPVAIYKSTNSRSFWPWLVGGDAGKISVVWYQTEPGELADLDCQPAHVHAYEETILNATAAKPTGQAVDAAGRVIHDGPVCQGGTTCVVTGKDRRLGDYFTNALDARGCVVIATGDTMLIDPLTGAQLPTSRPLFVHQIAGPALRGKASCS